MVPPHCRIEPGAHRALGMKPGWERHREQLGQAWGLVQIRAWDPYSSYCSSSQDMSCSWTAVLLESSCLCQPWAGVRWRMPASLSASHWTPPQKNKSYFSYHSACGSRGKPLRVTGEELCDCSCLEQRSPWIFTVCYLSTFPLFSYRLIPSRYCGDCWNCDSPYLNYGKVWVGMWNFCCSSLYPVVLITSCVLPAATPGGFACPPALRQLLLPLRPVQRQLPSLQLGGSGDFPKLSALLRRWTGTSRRPASPARSSEGIISAWFWAWVGPAPAGW